MTIFYIFWVDLRLGEGGGGISTEPKIKKIFFSDHLKFVINEFSEKGKIKSPVSNAEI